MNLLADTNENYWEQSRELDASLEAMVPAAMPHPILWQKLRYVVAKDKVMTMLADQISTGFPPEKKLRRLELREFFQNRDVLSQVDSVPLYKLSFLYLCMEKFLKPCIVPIRALLA